MSFDDSYQLLELTGDEGVKTFAARQISTGKTVTVFLFVGEQAQMHAELLRQLRTADPGQLPGLIEVGDNRGTDYVVMEQRLSLAELKNWFSRQKSAPPQPEHKPEEFTRAGIWRIPPSLQSAPGSSEKGSDESLISDTKPVKEEVRPAQGSFTRMFQAPASPIGESVPDAAPPPDSPPVQTAPGEFTRMFQAAAPPLNEAQSESPAAPPPPSAPGSFTRMFQAPASPIGESVPDAAPPPDSPPVQSAPGEFTRMFQAAAAPIGDKKEEATPKATLEPGEFTRFFNAAAAAPAGSASMPPSPETQGDFDRIFGSGDRPGVSPSTVTGIFRQSSSTPSVESKQADSASSLAAPPAFSPPPGDFTRVFGKTSPVTPPPDTLPSPSPASPPPVSGPGEYTRMFGSQPIPTEPIAPPPPVLAPESPVQAKQNSLLVPILIGVIVLLLAAIAVILIAKR